jgi:hypothetical protein
MANDALMAGQAGFEPATAGFGVRSSSQLELLTPGKSLDLDLSMNCMRPTRSAKFLKRKFIGGFFLVLRRGVILSLTLVASKPYDIPHECAPL